jgi:uncharacterized protein (DUF362 family)
MKRHLNRREFIKIIAAAAGTLSLPGLSSACSQSEQTLTGSPPPTSTEVLPTAAQGTATSTSAPVITPTTAPQSSATFSPKPTITLTTTASTAIISPVTPPSGTPDLVVTRGGEPEQLVQRALAALGGMGRFIHAGNVVVIKPNICIDSRSYEQAATTNPWVIAALVKMCLEAGASKVKVFDYPFSGSSSEAYVRSGIQEQVLAAGGEMVKIIPGNFIKTPIPQGIDLKSCLMYADILNADAFINVPIAKHHGSTRLTLGMKNIMGIVHNRSEIHENLSQRIADLTSCHLPVLTVIDAVRILVAHGPSGGSPGDVKKMDTLIISPDIVAADSYATSLFGLKPNDIGYIKAGAAMGLGKMDLKTIKIEEIQIS